MMDFDFAAHEPARNLVLGVGETEDLPQMREWLAELPADAYGHVFVEGEIDLSGVAIPAGVGVTCVPPFVEAGVALAEAVDSWLNEWVWVDVDYERSLHLWTRTGKLPAYGACRRRMQRLLGRREPAVAQPVNLAA